MMDSHLDFERKLKEIPPYDHMPELSKFAYVASYFYPWVREWRYLYGTPASKIETMGINITAQTTLVHMTEMGTFDMKKDAWGGDNPFDDKFVYS